MKGSKGLTDRQNEIGRRVVRRLLSVRFAGDQSEAARALGVSQPTLSNFLSGERGTGPKMIAGVAKLDPEGASAILAERDILGDSEPPLPPPAAVPQAQAPTRFVELDTHRDRKWIMAALESEFGRGIASETAMTFQLIGSESPEETMRRARELAGIIRADQRGKLVTSRKLDPPDDDEPPFRGGKGSKKPRRA